MRVKVQSWRFFLAALALASTEASGCGQSVPNCNDVCALPGAPGGCVASCTASQSASATAGATADFQAYLTCLDNAGTFAATECTSDAELVATESRTRVPLPPLPLGSPGGGGAVDASAPGIDAAGGTCASATCASVCAADSAPSSCMTACAEAQSACGTAAAEFQDLLTCLCQSGGWIDGTTTNTPCAAQIVALDQNCDAFEGGH